MFKHYLYRHIRLDKNEVFYIGIGTKPRKYNSIRTEYPRAYTLYGRNKYWRNITSKTEYRVEIVLESDDYDYINEKEIEFIELYGRKILNTGTLVNMADGGGSEVNNLNRFIKNRKHTKETKLKMSKTRKGKAPKNLHLPEVKERLKEIRRQNAKKVVHLETGEVYRCLSEACEIFNLHLPTEKTRVRRGAGTSNFKYLET